jgi:hypothetical protein
MVEPLAWLQAAVMPHGRAFLTIRSRDDSTHE